MRYPNLENALSSYGMKAHIARRTGISEAQIGRISRGESLPSLTTIKAIAKALGVSIDYLLREEITKHD